MELLFGFFILVVAGTLLLVVLKKVIDKFPRFGILSRTIRKERVRSKAEKRVADFLYINGISYEYEKSIVVGKEKLKPDFYLPEYDVYVEYRGLEGKLDTYDQRKRYKLGVYQAHGVKVISLTEKDLRLLHKIFWQRLEQLLGYRPRNASFRTRFVRFLKVGFRL